MRLLFIANVFPNPLKPTKGVFNQHLTRAMMPRGMRCAWFLRCRGLTNGRRGGREAAGFLGIGKPRWRECRFIIRGIITRQKSCRWYGWFYERSIRSTLLKLLSEWKPDAVLGYWLHPDGQAAATAQRMAGVPAGVIVGGSDILLITNKPSRRKRVQAVLDSLDFVVTVNQDLKEKTIGFGVDPAKVHVWQQGIDETMFWPGDKSEARTRLEIKPGPPVLLWVGHMVPVKGLEVMLEACVSSQQAWHSDSSWWATGLHGRGWRVRLRRSGLGRLLPSSANASRNSLGIGIARPIFL